jgi:hypothetical protein
LQADWVKLSEPIAEDTICPSRYAMRMPMRGGSQTRDGDLRCGKLDRVTDIPSSPLRQAD